MLPGTYVENSKGKMVYRWLDKPVNHLCEDVSGCTLTSVGQSRYCPAHRKEHFTGYKAMIVARVEARTAERDITRDVWEQAVLSAVKAGEAALPAPGTVNVTVAVTSIKAANDLIKAGVAVQGENRSATVTLPEGMNAGKLMAYARALVTVLKAAGIHAQAACVLC